MSEKPAVNYDEALVPKYTLPDPLRFLSGEQIKNEGQWSARRAEILHLFEEHMYGRVPQSPTITIDAEVISAEREVLDGRGLKKEVRLWLSANSKQCYIDLLMYTPVFDPGPCPFFIGYNFSGNHGVQPDESIRLSESWMLDWDGSSTHRAAESSRGREAARWPIARIVSRGYGLVTAYYGDVDPDYDDGYQNGIHPLFYKPSQVRPEVDEWGSIGAWAWGLSRILDYLEGEARFDVTRAAVVGHSRLGKTALWAGAADTRFNLVISNDSGCGGAALSRREFGETVQAINEQFPHWFCRNFHAYNHRVDELPVDQHMLIALVAPRPVYIASAQDDLWADPKGEFLSAYHAAPVYRLLGSDGLAADEMPEVEDPILSRIGYHIRRGGHDVTPYDWECFMDFADLHL